MNARRLPLPKTAIMPQIVENARLKELNSFGLDVTAKQLCIYHSPDDIRQLISQIGALTDKRILILGGGCNILFVNNFDGIIIHPDNSGISIESETDDYCLVKAGAGTVWDTLVEWAVERNRELVANSRNGWCIACAEHRGVRARSQRRN